MTTIDVDMKECGIIFAGLLLMQKDKEFLKEITEIGAFDESRVQDVMNKVEDAVFKLLKDGKQLERG